MTDFEEKHQQQPTNPVRIRINLVIFFAKVNIKKYLFISYQPTEMMGY